MRFNYTKERPNCLKHLLLEDKSAPQLYEYMDLVMSLKLSFTHIKSFRLKCFKPSLQIQLLMRAAVLVEKQKVENTKLLNSKKSWTYAGMPARPSTSAFMA